MRILLFLITLLSVFNCISASDKAVEVNLRNPTFLDGIFYSNEGGVVSSDNLRIQAKNMQYIRQINKDPQQYKILAEDDLMIEYEDTVFVGDKLEYDFITQKGTLYNGRTEVQSWYIGGKELLLNSDKTYDIKHGYVTSCYNIKIPWKAQAETINIKDKKATAKNFKIFFWKLPVFWLPKIKSDVKEIFNSPVDYKFQCGSGGTRFYTRYNFLTWKELRAFLRLEYRFNRGIGGGVETEYEKNKHRCYTRNYVANDTSSNNPNKHFRYRFEGIYDTKICKDKVDVNLKYDILSDREVVTDFYDRDFNLQNSMRTELLFRNKTDYRIVTLLTRVRTNPFLTTLQTLPKFNLGIRPFNLGNSGIISNSSSSIGFLDYKYAQGTEGLSDYHSARVEFNQQLYRPFKIGFCNFTPSFGLKTLLYDNNQHGGSCFQPIGLFSCDLNTHFYRYYDQYKHTIEPYLSYQYVATSRKKLNNHFIFNINDGYAPLNTMRFGIKNFIFTKNQKQPFFFDLYAEAFINTPTISGTIPRCHAIIQWLPYNTVEIRNQIGWNIEKTQFDYYNTICDWTVSENLALSLEYRHRGSWKWRKANKDNFFIDAFCDEDELRSSVLSDRRNTILSRLYYKISHDWALKIQTRNGWNRPNESNYWEYKIELIKIIFCSWQIRFFYQHAKTDDRIGINFAIVNKTTKQHKTRTFL